MPPIWQINSTLWINPAHIVFVEDDVYAEGYSNTPTPLLGVMMVAVAPSGARFSNEKYTLVLDSEAREKLLAYLARETESAPPPAPE